MTFRLRHIFVFISIDMKPRASPKAIISEQHFCSFQKFLFISFSPNLAEEPSGETISTKYRTTFDDKKVNYRFYLQKQREQILATIRR